MVDKIELFKLLLHKDFYAQHRHKIDPEVFPEVLWDLYDSLQDAHAETVNDVTCRGLYAIHKTKFPSLTTANDKVLQELIKKIHEAEDLDRSLADVVVSRGLDELKAMRIAKVALSIAEGKEDDWGEIQRLLDDNMNVSGVEFVSTDIEELTKDIDATFRWHFNLPQLDQAVGKIGPEVFGVLAGPVNSGKSLMGIHFAFGPDGFADQGAKVMYIGNEENLKRTMLRAMCCYTGRTKKALLEDIIGSQRIWNQIKDRVFLINDYSMSVNKLSGIIPQYKPDIVLVDMLDKLKIGGTFSRTDEKLGKIYESAREIAKKHQCVVFGMSQTNGDSFGQLTIEQNQMAGSRVDKAANADLLFTLGSLPSTEEGQNLFRRLYVAKSKLEGNGEKINCRIIPEMSRLAQ